MNFTKKQTHNIVNSPFYRVRCSGKSLYCKNGKWAKNDTFKRCFNKKCNGLVVHDICNNCGIIQSKVDYSDEQIKLIQSAILEYKLIRPAGGFGVNHFKHNFTYDLQGNLCFWFNTQNKSTHLIKGN